MSCKLVVRIIVPIECGLAENKEGAACTVGDVMHPELSGKRAKEEDPGSETDPQRRLTVLVNKEENMTAKRYRPVRRIPSSQGFVVTLLGYW
jgi:hypothetical protein